MRLVKTLLGAIGVMKFYHTEWCPECALVRDKLEELDIPYEDEIVPDVRPFRKKVYEVSGQYYVPVLVDGDQVLTETAEILSYLNDQHGGIQDVDPSPTTKVNPDERNG